jgi:hypothetical protein
LGGAPRGDEEHLRMSWNAQAGGGSLAIPGETSMKKQMKKLVLAKETLRRLEDLIGGNYVTHIQESCPGASCMDKCPIVLDTVTCD